MFQDLKGPINPTLQSSYEFLKDFFKEVWFVIKDIYLKPDFVIERRNMLIVIDNSTSVLKVILSLSYPLVCTKFIMNNLKRDSCFFFSVTWSAFEHVNYFNNFQKAFINSF